MRQGAWVVIAMVSSSVLLMCSIIGGVAYALGAGDVIAHIGTWGVNHGW